MALTVTQLTDARADLGGASTTVFTDDELNRNYDRVSGATNDNQRWNAFLGLCWRQLMASAVKLRTYVAGQTEEKIENVYKHIRDQYDLYKDDLEAALNTQSDSMAIVAVRAFVNANRVGPSDA